MKRLYILLLLFISSITLNAQSSIVHAAMQADRIASKTFEDKNFPGMAIAVYKKGAIELKVGYGFADIEAQIPVDPARSKFRIGSVSKPFTAAALAKLYEAGKIDLDAPIQTYVPDFPKKKYDITLRQLGGHLAGIRHYRGFEFMSNKFYPTVSEGLDIFKNDTLIHQPGSRYSYSSYGWNLISVAIETAADTNFLAYMHQAVFEPLQLDGAMPEYSNQEIEDLVTFYIKNGTRNSVAPDVDNSYKWAGGGFVATAEDVLKFGIAHLKAGYLEESTLEEWTKPQQNLIGKSINYGIGWRAGQDKKGRLWYGHSGGSVGGTSMLLIYPEAEIVVVTLVNQSSASMGNLAFRIANQFFDNSSKP